MPTGQPFRPRLGDTFAVLLRSCLSSSSADSRVLETYFQEDYDGDYGEVEASDDRQPVFQSVLHHLSLHRSPPGTLLDIGCGDGEFLVLCRDAGWSCSGIELSRQAAMRAAQKGVTVLSPNMLERGEWARHFDIVTMINVLETVADPVIMLRQATILLASGGLVIVRATNSAFHLSMRAPARWIGSQYDQAFHWYLYSAKALTVLMEGAGLTVISLRNSKPSRGPSRLYTLVQSIEMDPQPVSAVPLSRPSIARGVLGAFVRDHRSAVGERAMSACRTHERSWKRILRGWAALFLLCLFGAVAALGVRTLLDSVGTAKHTRYEPVDVPPHSVSPQHDRERQELERRDRAVLAKGK